MGCRVKTAFIGKRYVVQVEINTSIRKWLSEFGGGFPIKSLIPSGQLTAGLERNASPSYEPTAVKVVHITCSRLNGLRLDFRENGSPTVSGTDARVNSILEFEWTEMDRLTFLRHDHL